MTQNSRNRQRRFRVTQRDVHTSKNLSERLANNRNTFLIINDYPEEHATRYPWLAHYISRFPESIEAVFRQGRLQEEIPGVGETMETIIGEFLTTGTSAKLEECVCDTPRTVAELVPIPGLGAKTIKRLYQEVGVESLVSLRAAIDEGRLKGFRGIGPKTLAKIEAYLDKTLPGT